ncbi:MAG: MerR family transcriptional regulator [Bdellovibrionales bacterium]|nr:MerR family transcriptional regulator [Bdellovibrionales bacterium]
MLDKELTDQWMEEQLDKIPSKLSFRIGEVAKILSIKPYILRYWESEFDQLRPGKMDNKQRLYFHKDIETLLLIKKLLYKDGYSIRGAKQALKSLSKEFKTVKKEHYSKDRVYREISGLLDQVSKFKTIVKNAK